MAIPPWPSERSMRYRSASAVVSARSCSSWSLTSSGARRGSVRKGSGGVPRERAVRGARGLPNACDVYHLLPTRFNVDFSVPSLLNANLERQRSAHVCVSLYTGLKRARRRIDVELAISCCVEIRRLSICWAIDQGSNVRVGINLAQVAESPLSFTTSARVRACGRRPSEVFIRAPEAPLKSRFSTLPPGDILPRALALRKICLLTPSSTAKDFNKSLPRICKQSTAILWQCNLR